MGKNRTMAQKNLTNRRRAAKDAKEFRYAVMSTYINWADGCQQGKISKHVQREAKYANNQHIGFAIYSYKGLDGKRVYDYIRTDKVILVEDFVPEYSLEKICSNAGEVQRWYLAHKEAQYV